MIFDRSESVDFTGFEARGVSGEFSENFWGCEFLEKDENGVFRR